MDKEDLLAMKPSITRYRKKISGPWALAIDGQSHKEEMIEPGAVALMYEAYLLVASKTDPHYALRFIRMLADNMDDVRNIIIGMWYRHRPFTNSIMCSGKPSGDGQCGDIPRKVGARSRNGISKRSALGVGYLHVQRAGTHMRNGNG